MRKRSLAHRHPLVAVASLATKMPRLAAEGFAARIRSARERRGFQIGLLGFIGDFEIEFFEQDLFLQEKLGCRKCSRIGTFFYSQSCS